MGGNIALAGQEPSARFPAVSLQERVSWDLELKGPTECCSWLVFIFTTVFILTEVEIVGSSTVDLLALAIMPDCLSLCSTIQGDIDTPNSLIGYCSHTHAASDGVSSHVRTIMVVELNGKTF